MFASRATVPGLIGVTVLAALLRVWGANWGLPQTLHPDEFTIVEAAIDMAQRRSFEPTYYFRPDHLEIKLNYVLFMVFSLVVHGASAEVVFGADPSPFYLIARLLTACFGVASVVVAFLVARRISDRAGLVAGLLLAVFPLGVLNAHFATPDVPLTFLFLLITLLCIRYLEMPSTGRAAMAGGVVGAAVTVKYPGVVAGATVAMVVGLVAWRQRSVRRLVVDGLASLGAMVAAIFVISPVLITNVVGVRAAIEREARPNHYGADGLGFFGNLSFYGVDFFHAGGAVVCGLAFWGLVVLTRRRSALLIPFGLGVVMLLAISVLSLHWSRWGLPVYTTPLLLAAAGIDDLWSRAARSEARQWRLGLGVVTAFSVLVMTAFSAAEVSGLTGRDTRAVAAEWSAQNGVTAENSVFEGYTQFLPNAPRRVSEAFEFTEGRLVPRMLTDVRPQYLVITYETRATARNDPKYVSEQAFYDAVEDQYDRIALFKPTRPVDRSGLEPWTLVESVRQISEVARGGTTGPTIAVYVIP